MCGEEWTEEELNPLLKSPSVFGIRIYFPSSKILCFTPLSIFQPQNHLSSPSCLSSHFVDSCELYPFNSNLLAPRSTRNCHITFPEEICFNVTCLFVML